MSFSGDLTEFPLVPLIRLFGASRSTGVLELRHGVERAALSFSSGDLIAAAYGSDQGDLALGAALSLASGTFKWEAGGAAAPNLSGNTDELLSRGAALQERLAEARRAIKDERARFALAGGGAAERTLAVKPQHWRVLALVDGRRDVDAIAKTTGEGRLATLRTIAKLLQQGLITIIEPPARAPKAARAPRRRPTSEAAAPAAADTASTSAEPVVEGAASPLAGEPITPASQPVAPVPEPIARADEAPTMVGFDRLTAEVDARLAAIAALPGDAAPAPPAEPSAAASSQAAAELAPGASAEQLTQVVVSHYLPPTVERPELEPAKESVPERRGLFGIFRGRTVATPKESLTLPSAEQLARLVNAFLVLAAQTPGAQPSQSAVKHLQQLYQTRPIGRRVPTRTVGDEGGALGGRVPDLVDEGAVAADPAADQLVPQLAALVQQVRDVESRALGVPRATSLYRQAVMEVFGKPRHESASTQLIRRVATPLRARVTVRAGGPRGPYELSGREFAIGRSSSNQIVLTDASVSSHHARLTPRADGFVITDLGSRNGTTVNGERVTGSRLLRGGEAIGIGEALLDFEMVG